MSHARAMVGVCSSGSVLLLAAASILAQDVIGPGSTPKGDILRGEGVYLRGRGIYELYSAKARRVDAGTEIMIQNWNKQVYDAYLRERAGRYRHKKNLNNAQQAAAKQARDATEERLRTSPTDEDVVSGEALNALLVDLSDPMLSSASWRKAPVALPPEISIRSLFFRFAPRLGDKNAGALSNNLIALGRLDQSRGWPIFIPEDKVGAERRAYEATHRELLAQCEHNTLKLETVTKVDAALAALRAKVIAAVPVERSFRSTAVRYVDDMQKATKIFDATTIDFAQEMIRDTHEYNPQTVAELLAFLRKYRLFFASAEGRAQDGDVYRTLFGLMRDQKQKLGLSLLPPELVAANEAAKEAAQFEGRWVLVRTVRDGKVTPAPKEQAKKPILTIHGPRYSVGTGQSVWNSGTWTLDTSKTPKVFDRVGVNAKKQSVNFLGIYDWTGGSLRICFANGQRPHDFKAPPGSGRSIQVWARIKP